MLSEAKLSHIDAPDCFPLCASRQIYKEDAVKPFGSGKLWRQLGNVVGRTDYKHIARVIIQPGEQRPKEPGQHA